uniref:Uncharacterized protein n=1 Tax=Pipistrellus kuhlii TaxID=59472 RepID=A0A7J7XC04_PIPKU|nr:hypothetical protein mPipKuh1_010660 [Pipistrellus kuhlii]
MCIMCWYSKISYGMQMCGGYAQTSLLTESNMQCVETWPLPAKPWAGFGPAARSKVGPDLEMAASSEMQVLPQPNVSSVTTRGPPPCFSLNKRHSILPAALALQPQPQSRNQKMGEEEEGRKRRGEGEKATKKKKKKKKKK